MTSALALAVVVPAHNEANGIAATMAALAAQTDRDFATVLVANACTDATIEVATRAAARHGLSLTVVDEPRKGTGTASDTGVRAALARGATHVLRTDADTLPAPDWIAAGRRAFAAGADLVTGPMLARTDDIAVRPWEVALLRLVVLGCRAVGRLRPGNRGPHYRTGYLMSPGCNLGVRGETYLACGGFPHGGIETVHEDRELVNRVRRVSSELRYCPDLVVRASVRRLRAYGLPGTLRWYLDHGNRPKVVDVRVVGGL